MGIVRDGAIVVLAGATLAIAVSEARSKRPFRRFSGPAAFKMLDNPVASAQGAVRGQQASSLRGSRLAALSDGALVIDGDSGKLLRLDTDGKLLDSMSIGIDAAQLVVDRTSKRAYISDRNGDRIVVVRPSHKLKKLATFKTRTEPFGLALSPDSRTLLVTFVADRRVSGYNAETGKELWSLPVGPEPRGISISPDGQRAMVTFLSQSGVTRLALRKDAAPKVMFNALAAATNPQARNRFSRNTKNRDPNAGRKFVRNAFGATYLGNGLAVISHQISTPHQNSRFESRGTYGGGGRFNMPIEHRITFVRETPELPSSVRTAQATLPVHQPRALAYDGRRDILYIAGYGSDNVVALRDASRPTIKQRWISFIPTAGTGCGPSALDVRDDGAVLAYCDLSRKVATIKLTKKNVYTPTVTTTSELTKSRFTAAQLRGRMIFRQGNNRRLSGNGAMACASCHPEGRNDGLSWRIQGKALQTPFLAARMIGTHPFKWDGGDKDLDTSLKATVKRLGGFGINAKQAKDLAAFLAVLPKPRTPTVTNKYAVARGKQLFHSKKIGCAKCHSGPNFTNGKSYDLANDLKKVDTPSLIGLAHSAPYYHDGSAATLRALLLENGTIHGMGKLRKLKERDITDLIAYLKTL